MTGYSQGVEDEVLDLDFGDIQIFAGDYVDNTSMYTTIKGPVALLTQLGSASIALRGVDVARDTRVSLIDEKIALGCCLDPNHPHGVFVARRLPKALDVKPGNQLVILSQAADGSMANDLYTVLKVLRGIADAIDQTAIFMAALTFREVMVFPRGVHQMFIERPEAIELETAATTVQRISGNLHALDDISDLGIKTWKQLMAVVAKMRESTQRQILVVFFNYLLFSRHLNPACDGHGSFRADTYI